MASPAMNRQTKNDAMLEPRVQLGAEITYSNSAVRNTSRLPQRWSGQQSTVVSPSNMSHDVAETAIPYRRGRAKKYRVICQWCRR